jgi:hypothetical protein
VNQAAIKFSELEFFVVVITGDSFVNCNINTSIKGFIFSIQINEDGARVFGENQNEVGYLRCQVYGLTAGGVAIHNWIY